MGQLTNIDYSDDTPDVAFTYDRMGRQATVTDVLGARVHVYDPVTFDLVAERLPDGHVLARMYDHYGRPVGIALDDAYQVTYDYDDASRFAVITSAVNGATSTVKYAYLAQSDLLSGWTVRGPSFRTIMECSRFYEASRDMVSTVRVARAGILLAQYDYVNDPLGRRVSRVDRGTKPKGVPLVVQNVFGYNARSELDAAVMGTNQYGYQYDAIGNRLAAVANDQTIQYDANALNY